MKWILLLLLATPAGAQIMPQVSSDPVNSENFEYLAAEIRKVAAAQAAATSGNYTVGFDSSTQIGSLNFPGSGATANNVCLPRSTLTVTGHGCQVQIIFNAPVSECNSNQQMSTSFLINGAFATGFPAGTTPGRTACAGTGITANASFDVKIPAPAAGTLQFCAIAYSSVGNFESTTTRPQFRVVEICNISN